MSEPREWFLVSMPNPDFFMHLARPHDTEPTIHVIEYSAYESLQAKLKVYEEALGRAHHAVANAWEWQVSDPEDSEMDRDQQIGNWCEKACNEIKTALEQAKGMK
jgi:hypothetical protein